jgi:hypothetical protein
MTQQCRDGTGTQFSRWLRRKHELDSGLGYVATNLDYIWCNYKHGKYMLIEEKRFMTELRTYQEEMFRKLDNSLLTDTKYKGFHLIQFENTSPVDGTVLVDDVKLDNETFIDFLRFRCPCNMYISYFKKNIKVV